ncbi:hypothetical protein HAX54_044097 [Datura stramonium]|uniref:CUE domain-containing protein n=1 Tax=Datura stramonium TaxID=4076 RepID=A0ABS8W265_DATST|nr:hypothetical protein [Datura stramonium]
MSAIVCGKRSFFEDLQSPSPTSASPPISKEAPVFLDLAAAGGATVINQLRALFPDIESQFLEKALEECGNDLDAAVEVHDHLSHAQGKSVTASEADGDMGCVGELRNPCSAGAEVRRETAQNFQKAYFGLLWCFTGKRIEIILIQCHSEKASVAIQHERQKERSRNQEVQQLKQLIVQYQEQLRTLEVNNYSLKMHLQQAPSMQLYPCTLPIQAYSNIEMFPNKEMEPRKSPSLLASC